MGIKKIWNVLEGCKEPVTAEAIRGSVVVIDVASWIVRFKYKAHESTDCIGRRLVRRILFMLRYNIRPIFVFDSSKPISCKRSTIAKRCRARSQQCERQQRHIIEDVAHRLIQESLGNDYTEFSKSGDDKPSSCTISDVVLLESRDKSPECVIVESDPEVCDTQSSKSDCEVEDAGNCVDESDQVDISRLNRMCFGKDQESQYDCIDTGCMAQMYRLEQTDYDCIDMLFPNCEDDRLLSKVHNVCYTKNEEMEIGIGIGDDAVEDFEWLSSSDTDKVDDTRQIHSVKIDCCESHTLDTRCDNSISNETSRYEFHEHGNNIDDVYDIVADPEDSCEQQTVVIKKTCERNERIITNHRNIDVCFEHHFKDERMVFESSQTEDNDTMMSQPTHVMVLNDVCEEGAR